MKKKELPICIVSDFETTTDNPLHVKVWSAESIDLGTQTKSVPESCVHQTNIADYINYIVSRAATNNVVVYFHNLKFDGSYILDYLEHSNIYQPNVHVAYDSNADKATTTLVDNEGESKYKMPADTYTYTVNNKNVMYSIFMSVNGHFVEFRDSLKLLPFPLRKIAKDFNTPHKKLEMNFSNKQPGYIPTPEEMSYIENDVLVLKEGLEAFADSLECDVRALPMTDATIALNAFKETLGNNASNRKNRWNALFPNQLMFKTFEGETFDRYVRDSYHGGWCYTNPKYQGKKITLDILPLSEKEKKQLRKAKYVGLVFDVNSLYPSMMHSKSGCFYPYGNGVYRKGEPDEKLEELVKNKKGYYFIRFSCEFRLKKDHLPTVQIKNNPNYKGTEWLTTSSYYSRRRHKWIRNRVTLTMTCIDWKLFQEHYDIIDLKIDSHIRYKATTGIFDNFIDKWYEIKKHSKGAKRQLAKIILNSSYGKFAQSNDGSYIVYRKGDSKLLSETVKKEDDSRVKYIPIGAAITSWARNFTIRHAQKNYDRFLYADTDSIHMFGLKENAVGIEESPSELCCWKNETKWDKAIFAGQKRYIEHVVEADLESCNPYHNVKCCGMGEQAKENLIDFFETGRYDYDIFKDGLVVGGNLKGHRVDGGIFLQEQAFQFHGNYQVE